MTAQAAAEFNDSSEFEPMTFNAYVEQRTGKKNLARWIEGILFANDVKSNSKELSSGNTEYYNTLIGNYERGLGLGASLIDNTNDEYVLPTVSANDKPFGHTPPEARVDNHPQSSGFVGLRKHSL